MSTNQAVSKNSYAPNPAIVATPQPLAAASLADAIRDHATAHSEMEKASRAYSDADDAWTEWKKRNAPVLVKVTPVLAFDITVAPFDEWAEEIRKRFASARNSATSVLKFAGADDPDLPLVQSTLAQFEKAEQEALQKLGDGYEKLARDRADFDAASAAFGVAYDREREALRQLIEFPVCEAARAGDADPSVRH